MIEKFFFEEKVFFDPFLIEKSFLSNQKKLFWPLFSFWPPISNPSQSPFFKTYLALCTMCWGSRCRSLSRILLLSWIQAASFWPGSEGWGRLDGAPAGTWISSASSGVPPEALRSPSPPVVSCWSSTMTRRPERSLELLLPFAWIRSVLVAQDSKNAFLDLWKIEKAIFFRKIAFRRVPSP